MHLNSPPGARSQKVLAKQIAEEMRPSAWRVGTCGHWKSESCDWSMAELWLNYGWTIVELRLKYTGLKSGKLKEQKEVSQPATDWAMVWKKLSVGWGCVSITSITKLKCWLHGELHASKQWHRKRLPANLSFVELLFFHVTFGGNSSTSNGSNILRQIVLTLHSSRIQMQLEDTEPEPNVMCTVAWSN